MFFAKFPLIIALLLGQIFDSVTDIEHNFESSLRSYKRKLQKIASTNLTVPITEEQKAFSIRPKNVINVSIGIPAYNEARNIGRLLDSILKQKGDFKIQRLIIACDACTDDTVEIVSKYKEKTNDLLIINGKERKGKSYRLNEIYSSTKGKYLITLDADLVLKGPYVIDRLIKSFQSNKDLVATSCQTIPVKADGLIAGGLWANHIMWDYVRTSYNSGDNIFCLTGCATAITNKLAKSIHYPKNLVCDQNYLYISSKRFGEFKLTEDAQVYYRPVATLHDVRLQSTRTFKERQQLLKYFGKSALDEFKIPLLFKLRFVVKTFFEQPLYMFMAVWLNIYMRTYALNDETNNAGLWQQTVSSKLAIKV